MTAPPYQTNQPRGNASQSPGHVCNPQTHAFLEVLELPYLLDHALKSSPEQPPVALLGPVETDPNEIPMEDEDSKVPDHGGDLIADDIDELESRSRYSVTDPDEIVLCEDED